MEHSTDATAVLGSGYCPLGRDAFAQLHKDGNPANVAVRMPINLAEDLQVKGGTVTFVSTSGVIDRDHDIIKPKGLDVTAWNMNPVILAFHDSRQVIAVGSTRLTSRGDKWITEAEFFPKEISPLGDSLRAMIEWRKARSKRTKSPDRGGSFSLGFMVLKSSFVSDRGGFDIEEAEKLEDSFAPLPSNRMALVKEMSGDGLSLDPLFDWAEGLRRERKMDSEFAQGLIEVIDPTKGLELWELNAGHLKHLSYNPPPAPEPAAETGGPLGYAAECHEKGLGEGVIKHLLEMKFGSVSGAPDPAPAEPTAPEADPEPVTPEEFDWKAYLDSDKGNVGLGEAVKAALASPEIEEMILAKQAADTGRIPI